MKKNQKIRIFILLLIITSIIILVDFVGKSETSEELEIVCVDENCFDVQVVDLDPELTRGLMFRETLDKDKGMLFIFSESNTYSFWMKNTLIPLDIIWIDENKNIVYINENTLPCLEDPCTSYIPDKEALYVLEINAGLVEEFGIETGDKIQIRE